jgi:hypothetical protein
MATNTFYRDVNNDNKWTIDKDPDAILEYSVDWSSWLATGDTISTSNWVAETGLTVMGTPVPIVTGGNITTAWLAGGTAGNSYLVTNSIVTALPSPGGRTEDRSFVVKVAER